MSSASDAGPSAPDSEAPAAAPGPEIGPDTITALTADIPGVKDVSLAKNGRVLKYTYQPGNGEMPSDGAMVKVHYVGRLPERDGEQFDASRTRGTPFEFRLGRGQVIRGWDEGVSTMCVGERALFTIAPDYAYGESGSGSIPGNATLNFDVELLDFDDPEFSPPEPTTWPEVWERIEQRKTHAAAHAKKGKWQLALNQYSACQRYFTLSLAVESRDDFVERKVRLALLLNQAQCYLKLCNYEHAIEVCSAALRHDRDSFKAYYRRALAYEARNEYEKAVMDINVAMQKTHERELKPLVKRAQKRLQQKYLSYVAKRQSMFSGYFDREAALRRISAAPARRDTESSGGPGSEAADGGASASGDGDGCGAAGSDGPEAADALAQA